MTPVRKAIHWLRGNWWHALSHYFGAVQAGYLIYHLVARHWELAMWIAFGLGYYVQCYFGAWIAERWRRLWSK